MPIYEYECQTCGIHFEKRQSFNDEPHADCPNGHAETRRLLAAPLIVFKGSGFYVNDSRSKNGVNRSSDKKSEKSSSTKSDKKSETNKKEA
jgi:putative FmdB family regulatory protein